MEIVVTGDCIFYVKDLLAKNLCRTVIENYERDPRRRPGCTVGSRGAVSVAAGLAAQLYRLQDPALPGKRGTLQMAFRCARPRRLGATAGDGCLSDVLDPHALRGDPES